VCVCVCVHTHTYTHTHTHTHTNKKKTHLLFDDALELVIMVCFINAVRDETLELQRAKERERERASERESV
jgi:hypothetical protein